MLIPSIDLQSGHIVQLVQGEKLAIQTDNFEGWIRRFSTFPKVQLIDLDAAKNAGENRRLVAGICGRLPCRVGGGVRSVEDARALLAGGAAKVIVGSRLFSGGKPDLAFAGELAAALGSDRIIAAVDERGGHVVIDGWRTRLHLTPVEAIHAFERHFGEFLFTNVDVEGLMRGMDRPRIAAIRQATTRAISVAGGVTSEADVDWLAAQGMDAVVGMAIYTGRMNPWHEPPV
jgi:phosphoribosylformimino-5-aminoimidazole carboxamide ribotide isomerase